MSTLKLYIYLLKSPYGSGYDTYSDCVVIASSAENARFIYPNNQVIWNTESKQWSLKDDHDEREIPAQPFTVDSAWVNDPKLIIVKFLGNCTHLKCMENDVICASYHAG
jgi:hypothetical protein